MVAAARTAFAAALLAALVSASTLRGPVSPPPGATRARAPEATANTSAVAGSSSEEELRALRAKLETVADGLTTMLDPKGPLSHSKVASSLRTFSSELRQVLRETAGPGDPQRALRRLREAQQGVQALLKDITKQQVQLMKQGDDQEESLLLGVLMTRQHEPMAKQLEVLRSAEFRHLPAAAAVLAANSTATPLFEQVAAYLDAQRGKAPAASRVPSPPKRAGKPDVSSIVTALESRVRKLEAAESHRDGLHRDQMKKMEDAAKAQEQKKPSLAHRIRLLKRAEDRKFAKEAALGRKDVLSLKAAVTAIKTGDVDALKRAQSALQGLLKVMEAQSGGFLVFIQLAHRAEGLDCPYCAAQCVEKCHDAGKPYAACLQDCAGAGQ